jgi:hypothetical protein
VAGDRSILQAVHLTSQVFSYLLQGWTETMATASWEAAQPVSGQSPSCQGLEDWEVKDPPRPEGQEAKTPGKVIGPRTCQSVKSPGTGSSSPREWPGRGGVCFLGQAQCSLGITPSPLSCLPGCLCDSKKS